MDIIETQVQRTSPILRVTTDISEFKSRESKEDNRASETSRSGNSGEVNLRHASRLLQKKKQLRPLFGSPNPYRSSSFYAASAYAIHPNSKSNVSTFTQRIMSAKLLRVKQLQNELKETQIQLHESKNENRLLKTLQKRQDTALKKYEGDQAQLPQLIKSHNEEIRVLSTQYKQLKISYRELEQKLRLRDTELANLKEQHSHLVQLARDKHLGHRERLSKQVEDLKETVKEQNDRIQMLTRRVELEGKNYKHQLNAEMARHKETQLELAMAHETIESLKNLIEAKDKYINNATPHRFFKPPGTMGSAQVYSATNARFRNIPKTADPVIIHGKRDSEETINSTNFDRMGQVTDRTPDESTLNPILKNISSKVKLDSNQLSLRKKLSRKSNLSKVKLQSNDSQDDDSETPQNYSSSFPSINNSLENSKYNSSESDTMTKMSSIKNKRRVSIGSAQTISDDTSPYNEDDEFDDGDSNDNQEYVIKPVQHDDSDIKRGSKDDSFSNKGEKTKKKNMHNNKQGNKREKLRRNSISIDESDGPVPSISDSLMKAQFKDRLMRQKSIKDELKELEERLKLNNRKYALEKNNSFDSLLDQKTQSVKDELKEFEERLLNSNDLKSYNSSMSKTFEEEADKVVKKVTTGLDNLVSGNDNDKEDNNGDNDDILDNIRRFDFKGVSLSWNNMRDEFQRERELAESLLDGYYEKISSKNNDENFNYNNDDDDVDVNEEIVEHENEVKLDEEEKIKLLKKLKEIDCEDGGRKSSVYSSDSEPKERRNSTTFKYDLNSSENFNDNKASYSYDFHEMNNGDNSEEDFTQDFNQIKNKTELMQELFGNSDNPFNNKLEVSKNVGNT